MEVLYLFYLLITFGVTFSIINLIMSCLGRRYRKRSDQVPGPCPLPLIGNLVTAIGKEGFPAICLRLSNIYGPVFRMRLGQLEMYIVTGHTTIHEMLEGDSLTYAERPNWLYIPGTIFNKKGIIWTGGEEWDKVQRLVLKAVHDKEIQARIHNEILGEFDVVAKVFEESNGHPIYPEDQFWKAAFNIVSSFIFGKRFQHDDEEFQKLQDKMQFVAVNSKTQNPEHLFPFLAMLTKSKINKLKQQNEEINQFLRAQIEQHQQHRSDDHKQEQQQQEQQQKQQQQHDFIDVFLSLSPEERQHAAYLDDSIFKTIVDMYHGSMESMSGLLLWSVVYMCRYPDIQEKCQIELDKILGDKKDFVIERRHELPYTEATAKEIRRICGVVPFSALHTNDSDVTVSGMKIPRHSILLFHLQSACMDKDFWKNPMEFQPERFLEESNDFPAFKPFGYGSRYCTGSDIAIDTHLIFLANMLHRFQIVPAEKDKQPSLDGTYTGVTFRPKKFEVNFISRRNS